MKIKKFDPFQEKIVERDLWEVQEEHAEKNWFEKCYMFWKSKNFKNQIVYNFIVDTKWDRKWKEYMVFIPEHLYANRHLPMISIQISNIIDDTCYTIAREMELDEINRKILYKEVVRLIAEYDANPIEPATKPELVIDLRPYVFLRFLLSLPIIPEEVLHAMYVQQEAMQAQKRILEESERIKQLNAEHYAKYWNMLEKSKAYLTNFFK